MNDGGPRGDIAAGPFCFAQIPGRVPAVGPSEVWLLMDGEPVVGPGQPVDLDGDGIAEPGLTVLHVDPSSVGLSDDWSVSIDEDATLRLEAMLSTFEVALLEVRRPLGEVVCASSSGAELSLYGSGAVVEANLSMHVKNAPPGAAVLGFVSRTVVPGVQGALCLGPRTVRVQSSPTVITAAGSATIRVPFKGPFDPIAGERWFFQAALFVPLGVSATPAVGIDLR